MNPRNTLLILLLLCLLHPVLSPAIPTGLFRHFSHEDKLNKSFILKIKQDDKGFMWLGTFDGLIRFDGNNFRHFRPTSNLPKLTSNRVSSFEFDHNGRIWIMSEINELYYFDLHTFTFHSPTKHPAYQDLFYQGLIDYEITRSGVVWLFPKHENHLLAIDNDGEMHELKCAPDSLLPCPAKEVHEDDLGSFWIMTDGGICKYDSLTAQPQHYYFNTKENKQKTNALNTYIETDDDIWFAGKSGAMVRYAKQSNTFFEVNLGLKEDIAFLKAFSEHAILLITEAQGFYVYEPPSGKLNLYSKHNMPQLDSHQIKPLKLRANGEFWFETAKEGIYKFDINTRKLHYLHMPSSDDAIGHPQRSTLVLTNNRGELWIQPKGGALAYYDEANNRLVSIKESFQSNGRYVSDVMHSAQFDQQGNLWFCSFSLGLDLLAFNNNHFQQLAFKQQANEIKRHSVRSLLEDSKGYLWVGYRPNKIAIFNPNKQPIGLMSPSGRLSSNPKSDWGASIYSMMEDREGRIWLGTRGNGIFCLLPTEQPLSFELKHYKANINDDYSISSNDIYHIFQASSGKIYVATWNGGLNIIDESQGNLRFINSRNQLKKYPTNIAERIRSIAEDKYGNIYMVSPNGLFSFNGKLAQPESTAFVRHPFIQGNDILDIVTIRGNKIALATNGAALIMATVHAKDSLSFAYAKVGEVDMPFDGLIALQEGCSGDLWLVGDRQLTRYNQDRQIAESFPELAGIIGSNIFAEATIIRLASGEIIVGHSSGAVCFDSQHIPLQAFHPYLALANITIHGEHLHTVNPNYSSNVDALKQIELKHNQNFIKMNVSALDYVKPQNITYRYKLEGVDEHWNHFKGNQPIAYTNLPKGEYTLRIASTNSHNLWADNERQIQLNILPSAWESNWAYAAYLVLAALLLWLIMRVVIIVLRLKGKARVQQEIADMKLQFFTNISHEIRTPLTLISVPVEKMLHDESTSAAVKKQLKSVHVNTGRLLNLINQVLDLRRIENRMLEIEWVNLVQLAHEVGDSFVEISQHKKMKLAYDMPQSDVELWGDKDSLNKLLVNLLSNAFKFCHEECTITLRVEETDQSIRLKIIDDGPGIAKEVQKRLFKRFSNYNEDAKNPSTGIGLAIVKDIVDKHGAAIQVLSKLGEGSCFQIDFQKGHTHFDKDVLLLQMKSEKQEKEEEANEIIERAAAERTRPVGLIVEDDEELRQFMVSVLGEDYVMHEAHNGIAGHAKVVSLLPDFIISDVMMPQMDGLELLKIIRQDLSTSHIPLILLSAKTAVASKLEGMEYGADDYLTKPFNLQYLQARVKNILAQRKHLQQVYSAGDASELLASETIHISNKDHEFMVKVSEIVRANIINSDFSVEELGRVMGMSRASFFNKLKGLAGMPPVEFIREMRLNHAADLLKNDDCLIKEVCFSVGFSDVKYFGKCFKAKFGQTPAQYRNQCK